MLSHAEIDGVYGKVVGVFDSIETLLFDRSDYHAIVKQDGGTIVAIIVPVILV